MTPDEDPRREESVAEPQKWGAVPVDGPQPRRTRVLFSAAAALALVVTMIFATIGDGVEAAEATGLRAVVVEFGHTLVWALLTVAFTIAAVRGAWTRLAGGVAVAAAVAYVAFLSAVFLWR